MISYEASSEGTQALVAFIDPNGDESVVRCLCREDMTLDLGAESEVLDYLHGRYGPNELCRMARRTVLGPSADEQETKS